MVDEIERPEDGEGETLGRPERRPKKRLSALTGAMRTKKDLVSLESLNPAISDRIRADYPDLNDNALIGKDEVARYRQLYVEETLRREHGEFAQLEREVSESIARADTLAENTEEEYAEHRTVGEIAADRLAAFGGSWNFIIWFASILLGWIAVNLYLGEQKAFDAFPFILLNLFLSCLAAIQAPIIMMSQKRQEAKDRLRSLNDYRVNLKAELEIQHLHEKVDYLLTKQWQRMAEIQQLQLEILHEKHLRPKKVRPKKPKAKPRVVESADVGMEPELESGGDA